MALRDIPYGEVWPGDEIARRKALIVGAPCNMHWAVVERLPVHEDIRRGQGKLGGLFANHRQSLANLTAEAVHTVCCTFMLILDWTRPHLARRLMPEGIACAIAERLSDSMGDDGRAQLLTAIMSGLSGAYARYDVAGLRQVLAPWESPAPDDLRCCFMPLL